MNHKNIESMQDENLKRTEICPRFNKCSANICPLDPEVGERAHVSGEDVCPFTIKRRKRSQRGLVTRASDSVLKVIPEKNLKMLNKANQKRWSALHK